jgi:hypothetical protein
MNNLKKRTPAEWEKIKDIKVLDADGWRVDQKNWDDPISEKEWDRRIYISTISKMLY